MIGVLVHKQCRTTTPSSMTVCGRVLCRAPRLICGEPAYYVVYEDGEEECMPESEVHLWAATCGYESPIFQIGSTTTDAPPMSTATHRSFACNTAPPTTTTTYLRRNCEPSVLYKSQVAQPLWQWGRRTSASLSQGPLPPRQWPNYSYSWSPCPVIENSADWTFVQWLLVLIFAFLLAFFFNTAVDHMGRFTFAGKSHDMASGFAVGSTFGTHSINPAMAYSAF